MLGFLPRPQRLPALAKIAPAPPAHPSAALTALAAVPLDLAVVESTERFIAISVPAGDLVSNGRVAKFLIDRRQPAAPRVHFVNGNFTDNGQPADAARYHFFFAKRALGIPEELPEFNDVTYFKEPKRYVAGVVHTYFLDGGQEPIYGLQFYPQDIVREEGVLEALRLVKAQIPIPAARFAFVATGTQQTVATVGAELAAAGLEVLPLDRILGAIRYLPLNFGEAWGVLRIFPKDLDLLRPTDIPVFDELPLDLSVVAGVLTRAVQDANSHVNLKSKERGTPNAVLRDAAPDHPRLLPFADKPVHFVVNRDDFTLEPSTDEEVAAKLAERMNRPLIPLRWEAETRVVSYDEMAAGSPPEALAFASRFGSKATNLGFLAHREVLGRVGDAGSPSAKAGYDVVPHGFGVPLQFYKNLVDLPANSDLRDKLATLIAAEKAGTLSNRERADHVEAVQTAFLSAHLPPDDLAAIRAKLEEVLPKVKKIKVRSSANAEDIPNFDGAGLHDSFAANTEKEDDPDGVCRFEADDAGGDGGDGGEGGVAVKRKVKPKSLACAIKGVYASLWNRRAVEERSFARIDQETAAMGLAILPAYDLDSDVAANGVIITRVLNTQDVYGYALSLQEGNNLVTNPDPGTYSEVTIAGFVSDEEPVSLTVTRFAKPTPAGPERTEPVLPREAMLALLDLAKTAERAYCAAKPGYYDFDCRDVTFDNTKEKSLDLELKVLANGHFVCKQVREFGGK